MIFFFLFFNSEKTSLLGVNSRPMSPTKQPSPTTTPTKQQTPYTSPRHQSNEQQLIKLRVQNICCGKEATLVKNTLIDLSGIISVNVNVIGRIAYIKHDPARITCAAIIEKLNALHLGISLMESGADAAAKENAQAKRMILLRAVSVVLQTALFVAIIVATALQKDWDQWLAIPILLLGGIPMLYKAFLDIKRCVIANVNLLMLMAVAGTLAMREWLDGCLIVYVFSIAELLLQVCYYKVEKSLSGEIKR